MDFDQLILFKSQLVQIKMNQIMHLSIHIFGKGSLNGI